MHSELLKTREGLVTPQVSYFKSNFLKALPLSLPLSPLDELEESIQRLKDRVSEIAELFDPSYREANEREVRNHRKG